MELLVEDSLFVLHLVVGLAFAALAVEGAVAGARSWRGAWWLTAAFGSVAFVLLRGPVFDALGIDAPPALRQAAAFLLLLFPYLLLRFTGSFRRPSRWLERASVVAVTAVLLATVVLPPLPSGRPLPWWVTVYLAVGLGYWALVASVTVFRLWVAASGQPALARRRMRLMSAATAVLFLALFGMAANLAGDSRLVDFAVYATALVSAGAFGLGFSPPGVLRMWWARPEYDRLQRATMSLLQAESPGDVAATLLSPTARIVGGSGAALVDASGTVIGSHGTAPPVGSLLRGDMAGEREQGVPEVLALGKGQGNLVVWTSPFTPFFGREELGLLRAMAAVAGLALQRSALLAEERESRVALEQARHHADRARVEAMQANLAKTEFLSRMSHELRTPLNAILGFGQLLELSSLIDEDEAAVAHILKAGRHLLALINEVLDLSRIEAGTMTISLEAVHAGELLDGVVALIRPMADARSIQLLSDLASCDEFVRTDRQRCSQVLLNLLSNAVKYNYDGGQVTIDCTRVDDDVLRVSIVDTGAGIDPDRQSRLFQPFERLGAESSPIEGTGLGLALTKQLVQAMGGTIGVRSALGEGSTFWIDLPVTEAPVHKDQHPPVSTPSAEASESRTLLLVEDNLANLRLVQAILRRRPEITVVPAMQGRLAIDLARQHQPDAIILDLHLPDLSGQEVLHRLRADPITRHIPVVIASADATPGTIRRLREEGALDYLTKPLEIQPFLAAVDAALARSTGDGLDAGTGEV